MKINEWILTIFNVAVVVFCFSTGLIWQGWFMTWWLVSFGLIELLLKRTTGKTLSQHVWSHKKWKRVVLSVLMVGSMMALGWHFIWGGGV